MTNVLGLSCFYHDSAASLVQDGKLTAAVAEERFNREKHFKGFPEKAVKYCLEEGDISVEDLDYVVFYEKPFLKFERILKSFLSTFPKSRETFVKSIPQWIKKKIYMKKVIKDELEYDGDVVFPEHHQSHIGSSFLVSPFDEAAIMTVDATGEKATTTLAYGEGNDFEILKEMEFPHSLGLLYSTFTSHLGFYVNSGEGKIMGMSSYGEPKYYDFIMENLLDLQEDGGFKLNMDYFAYHYSDRMYSDKFLDAFGEPRDPDRDDFDQRHADLAASIQKVTEDIMLKMADHLYQETGSENLCLAGGVILNCVANGRLKRESPFENLYIQGAAGDDGGAVGAAFYTYNTLLDNPREFSMEDMYWGPSYTNSEIKSFLDSRGIEYKEFDGDEIVEHTAERIADGEIVGWFQGRIEFGPRALGNRSILADPRKEESKDIVNKKIKFRENWRPFAPSMLKEKAGDYMEGIERSPFMIRAYNVVSDQIPAVTHVDRTARPQTVTRDQNRRYHDLIKSFGDITDVYVLLNTSFNRRGEPIVCAPEDAFNCFQNSGLDFLVMEDILVEKDQK
ncbi:MAG: carbamoyltransferase [Candidatus Nanohaloarchaea archaeon]|nr:carbamoyltransferase [Candidatus Nanohaloarchaea archaeon]